MPNSITRKLFACTQIYIQQNKKRKHSAYLLTSGNKQSYAKGMCKDLVFAALRTQKSHLFENFRYNKELNVRTNIIYEIEGHEITYCLTKDLDVITSISTLSFSSKPRRRVRWQDGSSRTTSKNIQE